MRVRRGGGGGKKRKEKSKYSMETKAGGSGAVRMVGGKANHVFPDYIVIRWNRDPSILFPPLHQPNCSKCRIIKKYVYALYNAEARSTTISFEWFFVWFRIFFCLFLLFICLIFHISFLLFLSNRKKLRSFSEISRLKKRNITDYR